MAALRRIPLLPSLVTLATAGHKYKQAGGPRLEKHPREGEQKGQFGEKDLKKDAGLCPGAGGPWHSATPATTRPASLRQGLHQPSMTLALRLAAGRGQWQAWTQQDGLREADWATRFDQIMDNLVEKCQLSEFLNQFI